MVSSKLLSKLKTVKTILRASGSASEMNLKISTDTRTFQKDDTFVALVGQNFDAFNYLEQVLDLGAKAVVFNSTEEREELVLMLAAFFPETLFITVSDTLLFLQELAALHLKTWRKEDARRAVIGVTGSNGKTTHKEMIYFLLNELFPNKVLATKGNLNNHIGVPLTILGLEKKHKIAIIEMGMNSAGEIKFLCDIARPEHGMITNIGAAHIEFLGSMDNIFKEKKSLFDSAMETTKGKGIFVVNADDEYLGRLKKEHAKKNVGFSTYGERAGDVRIAINEAEITFTLDGQDVLITNKNILEHHNLKNLAGTALFAMKLFPKRKRDIALAAGRYEQPSMNRSQWIDHIFLDAYNANPSSMRISLDSFVQVVKNKQVSLDDCYFILGDMNELGDHAPLMHQQIAEHLNALGIKNVAFIGRYRGFYGKGFLGPAGSFETKEEFLGEWREVRKKFKYIFIKASRSLQLETLMTIV